MSIHNELVTVYHDTHKVELAQALWITKHGIEDLYASWDASNLTISFQEHHTWAVVAAIMSIQESVEKMNEYQLKANLKNAAADVQRAAGRIDNLNMDVIEYGPEDAADAESERFEKLKADYEAACDEVSYWSAKVYS